MRGSVPAGQGRVRLALIVGLAGLSLGACASTGPRVALTSPRAAGVELSPTVAVPEAKARTALAPLSPARILRLPSRSKARAARADRPAVGAPYKVAGVWYRPARQSRYDVVGVASWYGEAFDGRATANGERFDMDGISAAHATLPLASVVEVTNLENGRSIQVRLNDRGPFKPNRIIDLSRGAAERLGYVDKGLAKVRVRVVAPAGDPEPAPLPSRTERLQVARAAIRQPDAATTRRAAAGASSLVLAYEAGMRRIALERSGRQAPAATFDTALAPLW